MHICIHAYDVALHHNSAYPCPVQVQHALGIAMFQEVDRVVPDLAVLRRILFACAHLPKDMPHYWEEVIGFSFVGEDKPSVQEVKVLVENIECLDQKAFNIDEQLLTELYLHKGCNQQPLGVVLVSSNTACTLCGGDLLVRSDRPSTLTLYTDDMGTIPGTHFRKYCQNYRKGCSFTQHYSYHSDSEDGDVEHLYESNWDELPYFVSSNKTAFTTRFLEKFDADILLGHTL